MADTLMIRQLALQTVLGVPEAERRQPQKVLVDVWLRIDAAAVAKHDDVTQGFDYDLAVRALERTAQEPRHTLEKFVEDCAAALLALGVAEVSVSVTKFPYEQAEGVTLTITRP